jgi:hypothetical protein
MKQHETFVSDAWFASQPIGLETNGKPVFRVIVAWNGVWRRTPWKRTVKPNVRSIVVRVADLVPIARELSTFGYLLLATGVGDSSVREARKSAQIERGDMKDEFTLPGSVSRDDPAVRRAMETIDGLRPSEHRELLCSSYRAALAFDRTRDIDHLVNFAKNLIATVHLRGIPAYAEALRKSSEGSRSSGETVDLEEVLNRLME